MIIKKKYEIRKIRIKSNYISIQNIFEKKYYDVDNNETSEEQNSLKYKQNKKEKEEEVEDDDINNKDKDYQNKTDKSIE